MRLGAGAVGQQINLPAVTPSSIRALLPVLATLLPVQLPAKVPEKAAGTPSTWALALHVGDPGGIPGSWL